MCTRVPRALLLGCVRVPLCMSVPLCVCARACACAGVRALLSSGLPWRGPHLRVPLEECLYLCLHLRVSVFTYVCVTESLCVCVDTAF